MAKFLKRKKKKDLLSAGKCRFYNSGNDKDGSLFSRDAFPVEFLRQDSKSCPICALFFNVLCTFYGSSVTEDYDYYVYTLAFDDTPLHLWISDDDHWYDSDPRNSEYFGLELYTLPGT